MFKSANVTVMVTDFNKAVQFYVETLGLTLQHQVEGHIAQVEASGLSIGLLHPNGGPSAQPGKIGNLSIGLEVEDLDSAIAILKSRGVEFQQIIEENTARLVNFSDPDGNPLYFIQLKA